MSQKMIVACALSFVLGCGAAYVGAGKAPAARAGTVARWEFHCVNMESGINDYANKMGEQGWDLAGAAGFGNGDHVTAKSQMTWCFKRPRP